MTSSFRQRKPSPGLANEPEVFASVLERLLGKTAKVLEKDIAETLFERVGATIEKRKGYSFQALIRIAKAKFPRISLWLDDKSWSWVSYKTIAENPAIGPGDRAKNSPGHLTEAHDCLRY